MLYSKQQRLALALALQLQLLTFFFPENVKMYEL
jgi:hypothetical protein